AVDHVLGDASAHGRVGESPARNVGRLGPGGRGRARGQVRLDVLDRDPSVPARAGDGRRLEAVFGEQAADGRGQGGGRGHPLPPGGGLAGAGGGGCGRG